MVISPPPPRSTLFPYTKLFRSFSDTRYRSASKTFFEKTKRCCPPEGRTPVFNKIHDGVEWRGSHQVVRAQAWGADSIRVRAGLSTLHDVPGALHEKPDATPEVSVEEDRALVVNGTLTLEISGDGMLRFTRTDTGEELLQEERAHFWWPGPRAYTSTGNGYYRIEQRFSAQPDERLSGLGVHTPGLLDHKGVVIDRVQRHAEGTQHIHLT